MTADSAYYFDLSCLISAVSWPRMGLPYMSKQCTLSSGNNSKGVKKTKKSEAFQNVSQLHGNIFNKEYLRTRQTLTLRLHVWVLRSPPSHPTTPGRPFIQRRVCCRSPPPQEALHSLHGAQSLQKAHCYKCYKVSK